MSARDPGQGDPRVGTGSVPSGGVCLEPRISHQILRCRVHGHREVVARLQGGIVGRESQHVGSGGGEARRRGEGRGVAEGHGPGPGELGPRGDEGSRRVGKPVVAGRSGQGRGVRQDHRLVRPGIHRGRLVLRCRVHGDRRGVARAEHAVGGLELEDVGTRRGEARRRVDGARIPEGDGARAAHLAPGCGDRAGRVRQAVIGDGAVEAGTRRQRDRLIEPGVDDWGLVRAAAADRIGDLVEDAVVPVAPVLVRAEADRIRHRDRASRLRRREGRAVDGLDDLSADALADHLVPVPVDYVRPRLQLPPAKRTAEHARRLPVLLDFDLDLATAAPARSLREHVVIDAVGRERRRVQPVGDRDRRRPRYEIGSVRDDDRALGNEAVGGVELTRNPERDRAADRTVVAVSAAVEGGRAARLV